MASWVRAQQRSNNGAADEQIKTNTPVYGGKAEREFTDDWHLASLKIVHLPAVPRYAGHPLITYDPLSLGSGHANRTLLGQLGKTPSSFVQISTSSTRTADTFLLTICFRLPTCICISYKLLCNMRHLRKSASGSPRSLSRFWKDQRRIASCMVHGSDSSDRLDIASLSIKRISCAIISGIDERGFSWQNGQRSRSLLQSDIPSTPHVKDSNFTSVFSPSLLSLASTITFFKHGEAEICRQGPRHA